MNVARGEQVQVISSADLKHNIAAEILDEDIEPVGISAAIVRISKSADESDRRVIRFAATTHFAGPMPVNDVNLDLR